MYDFMCGPARFRLFLIGMALAVLSVAASTGLAPVAAQQIPKSLREGGPDDANRKQETGWTVKIAGSTDDATMRFADELGKALSDTDDLRVLPVISRNPIGNVQDLLYLRDIDIAVTQADALEYFRLAHRTALAGKVQYIARLPAEELHVAARENVHTLQELRGRKVVFGPAGSAAAMTGTVLFHRLGIAVKPVFTDLTAGLNLVKAGKAAALLVVDSKPSDFFVRVPPYAGIHLVPAPHVKALGDLYAADQFTSADYPNLIGPDEKVDTVSVPAVLAVLNLPRSSDRFRRVLRFVQYLYTDWDKLREPPFYPGWRDADLAATLPGWTRFSPSEVLRQFILWRERHYSHRLQ